MHFSESRVPIENRFLILSNSKYLYAVYYCTANPSLKIMYWSRQLAAISCMLPILYQIRHWTFNFLEFKVFYDIWVKTISIPDSRWTSIIRTKKWMWSKFESVEQWAAWAVCDTDLIYGNIQTWPSTPVQITAAEVSAWAIDQKIIDRRVYWWVLVLHGTWKWWEISR